MLRSTSNAAPWAIGTVIIITTMLAHTSGCGGGGGDVRHSDAGTSVIPGTDSGIGVLPAVCRGAPLEAPGVLDLAIPLITISGRITIDGRALTPSEYDVLELAFEETSTSARFTLRAPNLRPDGAYTLAIPPGQYDVHHIARSQPCDDAPGLPCNAGRVRERVAVEHDGVLDLELQTARLSARVVTGGAPADAGFLAISNEGSAFDTSSVRIPIHTGAADVRLLRGRYVVRYEQSDCDAAAPCGAYPAPNVLSLESDGVIDLHVPAIDVSGSVTLDGGPHAHDGLDVFFTGSEFRVDVRVHDARFSARLVPGTYDVGAQALGEICRAGGPLPCVPAVLRRNVSLEASGVLDLASPLVTVTGELRVDGESLSSASGAALTIAGIDGRGRAEPGASRWGATLFPGVYDVIFEGDPSGCVDIAPVTPCNSAVVVRGASLTSNGVLDVDVDAVRISGRIERSSASTARGSVTFTAEHAEAGAVRVPVAEDGRYVVTLVAGAYAIGWSSAELGCASEDAAAMCLEARLREDVPLTSDGVLDLPMSTFEVQGTLTVDELLVDEAGALRFDGIDGATHARAPVGRSGTYRVELVRDRYVASLVPDDASFCHAPERHGPCGRTFAAGCDL